jgi:hypothetical protein
MRSITYCTCNEVDASTGTCSNPSTYNYALTPIGGGPSVSPQVGDIVCWTGNLFGQSWSGNVADCGNVNSSPNAGQPRVVISVAPATSTSGAILALLSLPPSSCSTAMAGCTDTNATNYNPYANTDDGSCIAMVYGCMDPNAFNYYPGAAADDGTCVYMPGCMDPAANNYNVDADMDDGSCDYEPAGPNPDIPPSTAGTTSDCSELVVQVTNALAPQTFECAQDAMNNNHRFDPISVGRCVLIPATGDIATILEVNPGITAHPTVIEMVPCPSGPTGPTGPTPAPQSQCSNLVVSNLTSIATQQFNCVQNNGTSFPSNSIGKCVIIQGQQYKIEEVEPSTGTTFLNGEIVQCSIAEGAISRMQKLANIKK